MPPTSEQEHAVPPKGVMCLTPQHSTLRHTTSLCPHLENSGFTLKNVLSCSQEHQYELVSLGACCWIHEQK